MNPSTPTTLQNEVSQQSHIQNLDILRLVFASMVTVSHSFPLTGNPEPISQHIYTATGGSIAVQAFFFISGYLVTRSWYQTPSIVYFASARFLRVWPALIAALLLTIVLAYFASTTQDFGFFYPIAKSYFYENINLIDGVAYTIGDAYSNQPTNSVNGSLWTLPWEIRCYIALLFLAALGVINHRSSSNIATILLCVALILTQNSTPFQANSEIPLILFAFFAGSFVCVNSQYLSPLKAAILFFCLALISHKYFAKDHIATVLMTVSIVLIMGFTHFIKLPKLSVDLSYGIYIFSFPIQQFMISLGIKHPWLLAVLALSIAAGLAYLSWIFIEKPSIGWSKKIRRQIQAP